MAKGKHAQIRERLRFDTPYWARHCAKIVDRDGELVPLVANRAQAEFDRKLEEQRAKGDPMRAIILKARKLGFSTWIQARLLQRVTQFANRNALVVGQDRSTAETLFKIGQLMHSYLPDLQQPPFDDLKPRIANRRRGQLLIFGETSVTRQEQGLHGLNSTYSADTAKEVDAGRGYTYHYLHLSEVAFWPDVEKFTALVNAVPPRPETLIVLESTANGPNHFKEMWDAAEAGESSYIPHFSGWHEEPSYRIEFRTPDEREEFVDSIGEGEIGEEEPRLIERYGCTPEQLAWRRRIYADQCQHDLNVLHREYPSTPSEAFISGTKQVFSPILVQKVLDRTEQTDPRFPSEQNPGPERGIIRAGTFKDRMVGDRLVKVPQDPIWTPLAKANVGPRDPLWRIWAHPSDEGERKGRYIVSVDPSAGEQTEKGERAFHAIQVIDHRTLEQVAEWRSRIDPDLVGVQAYLMALYYNQAWLNVERTGGYGLHMLRLVWRDFRYPFVYTSVPLDKKKEAYEDRLGFDTNRTSKPMLEDGMRELLREGTHGIRSRLLAHELTTYVQDEKGRTGPEKGKFADLLMAYMMGQQIAREKIVPPDRKAGAVTSTRPQPRYASTGY